MKSISMDLGKSLIYPEATVVKRTIKDLYVIEEASFPPNSYGCDEEFSMTYTINKKNKYIGDVSTAEFLCDERGIEPQAVPGKTVCTFGKSRIDNKWYGWSHRAIFGFNVGSKCKQGDCHYIPSSVDDYIQDAYRRYSDKKDLDIQLAPNKKELVVKYTCPSNKNDIYYSGTEPITLGKGEWTAETEEDAKQMAIDFAMSVSTSFTSLSSVQGYEFLKDEKLVESRSDYLTHSNIGQKIICTLSKEVYMDVKTIDYLNSIGIDESSVRSKELELFGTLRALKRIASRFIVIKVFVIGTLKNKKRHNIIKQELVLTVPDYYPIQTIRNYESFSNIYSYVGDTYVFASLGKNLVMKAGENFVLESSGHNNSVIVRKLENSKTLELSSTVAKKLIDDSFSITG